MDLELLQRKSNKELIILLHNCIKSSDMKRADNIKQLVFEVLTTRNKKFLTGGSIDVMDADGVLSAFGYHVGDDGIKDDFARQRILRLVLETPIPPILDRNYVAEWGAPSSPERLLKTLAALHGFIGNKRSQSPNRQVSYTRALEHWEKDLKYLEQFKQ